MNDNILRADEDAKWRADGERHGWEILPASWPLRLPVIRFFRWAWLDYRTHANAAHWAAVGIGVGGPNQRDLWVLYAIRRGWA